MGATLITFSPTVLLALVLLIPATLSSSENNFTCSRATFYGSPDSLGTPRGACGFGELGRTLYGGNVGAVARLLYRDGIGCGACYHVRCTNPQLCDHHGVSIVVTDYGESDGTDFILSGHGFAKLARPNLAAEVMSYGVADVEYKRIQCRYRGYNLTLRLTEHSKFPDYLAFVFVYQAGKKDILAVQVWQEVCKEWKEMRRAYGGVWDIANPPRGPITLRFLTSEDGEDQKWVQLDNVIPCDWKEGATYETSIQIS